MRALNMHILVLTWAMGVSTAMAAATLDQLGRLVEAGEMARAYELAQAQATTHTGDPDFDAYFGIAAVATGHPVEGILALERALARQPDRPRARLALARGYRALGETQRAETAYRTVLAAQAPPEVTRPARRELAGMDTAQSTKRGRRLTGFIQASAGRDTNVNRATADESITLEGSTGSTTRELSSNEQRTAALFAGVEGGLEFERRLSENWSAIATGDLSRRVNSDASIFNTTYGRLRLGAIRRSEQTRLTLLGNADRLAVDGDAYRDGVAGTARLDYRLNRSVTVNTAVEVGRDNYPDQPIREAYQATAAAGLSWRSQGEASPAAAITLFGGRSRPAQDGGAADAVADRHRSGIRLQGGMNPARDWRVDVTASWRQSNHQGQSQAFDRKRRTQTRSLRAKLEWTITPHWQLGATVRRGHRNANIDLYDYDRTSGEVTIRYVFF